jgi:hypothetical protein
MNECAWCGDTEVALYGGDEWRICKHCTIAVSWNGEPPEPRHERERMFGRGIEQRACNDVRRPAGVPAEPPELDALLKAWFEKRATPDELLPYRELMLARFVCYFCTAAMQPTLLGALGPNVNICATCLENARAYHA